MEARPEAPKGAPLPLAAAAVVAKLKAASKAGVGFYDPAVRKLRAELAQALKSALLEDYATAQEHGVEQALWKVVYYRPIEEFRRRIRLASEAGDRGREPLRKAKAAFNQLLDNGAAFYRRLALDVQSTFGDAGCPLSFPEDPAADPAIARLAPSHPPSIDARPTVFRCLICLGDLARYQINAANEEPGRDWSLAARHYLRAARVLPSGGNAYNQLAVLATYIGDELSAVGHYFRALAVAKPFLVARDNLLLLFEQNRIRYEMLMGSSRGRAAARAAQQRPGRSGQPHPSQQPATMADLVTHFVRLHGVLFTRINVDTFPAVAAAAAAELQQALQNPGILRSLTAAPGGSVSDSPAMRLAVLAAFSVANVDYSPDGRPPGVAEALQRKELRQFALSAALQLAAALCGTAAEAKMAPPAANGSAGSKSRSGIGTGVDLRLRLLPAVHVLLLWVAGHPEAARPEKASSQELTSQHRKFLETAKRLRAWVDGQLASAQGAAGQWLRLPELVSLRGFLPLAPVGLAADTPPPAPLEYKEEQPVRLASIMDCLRRVCDTSSDVQLAGAAPEPAVDAAAVRQPAAAAAPPAAAPQAAAAAPIPLLDQDDEDEEVIVYAPGAGSPAQRPDSPQLQGGPVAEDMAADAKAPWQRPAAPAASAWTPPQSPTPTEIASPGAEPGSTVPEAAPWAGAAGGGGGGSSSGLFGGGGSVFDGGTGGGFLGRDIFALHRATGGSIGFGLADMGAPTIGGSSGGLSGDVRTSSPFATGSWVRPAPAQVASLWNDAAPQAMSQQEQWQQPHPAPAAGHQLSDPMDAPQPPSYQHFGAATWAVPPTPGAQPSMWQPPPQQVPQLPQQPQQPATDAERGLQQRPGWQQPKPQRPVGQPPLVQDWSWLDSLPTR